MNNFTWLVMGHLVGDWILQNDWMAKGKKEELVTPAGIVHYSIYTASVIMTLFLAENHALTPLTYYAASVFVFVTHWLVDATNVVSRWIHLYGQTDLAMIRVMVDQTLHLLTLAWLSAII